jgi:hypothetical protein
LNYFIIRKIAKKYEKIASSMHSEHSFRALITTRPNSTGDVSCYRSTVGVELQGRRGRNHTAFDDHAKDEDEVDHHSTEYPYWSNYPSYSFFITRFCAHGKAIKSLQQKCVNVYCSIFRETYPSLAADELRYVKNVDKGRKNVRLHLGLKIGIILTLVSVVQAAVRIY